MPSAVITADTTILIFIVRSIGRNENRPRRCCASFYFGAIENEPRERLLTTACRQTDQCDKKVIYCWPDPFLDSTPWPTRAWCGYWRDKSRSRTTLNRFGSCGSNRAQKKDRWPHNPKPRPRANDHRATNRRQPRQRKEKLGHARGKRVELRLS
jgi:hypothetical protein